SRDGYRSSSRSQDSRGGFGRNVAARDNQRDVFAGLVRDLSGDQRGGRGGSRGLDGELRAAVEQPERLRELGLADEHDLVGALLCDPERVVAGVRRVQAVGDRDGLDLDALARIEGEVERGGRFRLDADPARGGAWALAP